MLDTLSALIEKIYLGEDSTLEFKERLNKNNKDSFANEITAFANARGGVILIGISDNGDIINTSVEQLNQNEKMVIEICNDSIKPAVNFITEKMIIDGKNILKIEIPRSLFIHKSPNGYFIRQGSSKREMTSEQFNRLLQARSQARIIRFDEQEVPNTTIDALQQGLYKRFITNTPDDDKTTLFKRHLLTQENNATVAGILMCSGQPDDYLCNSFIQAVYYNSTIKDPNYQIDAQDFKGTLDAQIIDTCRFIKKYNKVSAIKPIGRIDKPQYSMQAIFEAVVNAVIHRDYSKCGSKIRISLFIDRLEIASPGVLANTLTTETMPYNQVTRNELLARLLSELTVADDIKNIISRQRFLETRGIGIGIILRESEQLSGKKPIYEMIGEELKLTIFAAKSFQEQDDN